MNTHQTKHTYKKHLQVTCASFFPVNLKNVIQITLRSDLDTELNL